MTELKYTTMKELVNFLLPKNTWIDSDSPFSFGFKKI